MNTPPHTPPPWETNLAHFLDLNQDAWGNEKPLPASHLPLKASSADHPPLGGDGNGGKLDGGSFPCSFPFHCPEGEFLQEPLAWFFSGAASTSLPRYRPRDLEIKVAPVTVLPFLCDNWGNYKNNNHIFMLNLCSIACSLRAASGPSSECSFVAWGHSICSSVSFHVYLPIYLLPYLPMPWDCQ